MDAAMLGAPPLLATGKKPPPPQLHDLTAVSAQRNSFMLQLGTLIIGLCAIVALLALARLITNWFANR